MMRPCPILFTIPNFITAGSGKVVFNIVKHIDRGRFSPSVCVLKKGGETAAAIESLGIPVFEAPFTVRPKPYATLPVRAWKASRFFNSGGFRLWHSFHYLDDYTEPIIAKMSGAQAWIYSKKNMSWGGRAYHVRSFFADRIVAQNESMMAGFLSAYRDKTRLIRHCPDTEIFQPGERDMALRRSWGFPGGSVVAVHVANILPVKNQLFLTRALAECKTDVRMIFAGAELDAAYARSVREEVEKKGLRNKVLFAGPVKDVAGLLRTADIFVLASFSEGGPVACLEAMACGRPSVVMGIPPVRELYRHEETGLIASEGDFSEFARCLDALSVDPEMRNRLGMNARLWMEQNATNRNEIKQYETLYSEILSL